MSFLTVVLGALCVEPTHTDLAVPLRAVEHAVPELLHPKPNSKLERYKQELLESIDASIARVEESIQDLKAEGAKESELRPYLELLESRKALRQKVLKPRDE